MKKSRLSLALLVSCLALLGMASAGDTAEVTVTAALYGSEITVTADAITPALWTLTVGVNADGATSPITVKTNAATWHVSAKDAGTLATAGHLISGTDKIIAAMNLAQTGYSFALSKDAQTIAAGAGEAAASPFNIKLSQTVVAEDTPHDNYKLTITYTGTPS